MRVLKRFISRVMIMVLLSVMVIPLLPKIEIKAEANIGPYQDNSTLIVSNTWIGSIGIKTENSNYSNINDELVSDTDIGTVAELLNKSYFSNVLNGASVTKDGSSPIDDDFLSYFMKDGRRYNYNNNSLNVNEIIGTFTPVAWKFICNKQDTTVDSCAYIIAFDTVTNDVYTIVVTLVDYTEKDNKDTVSVYCVGGGIFDLKYTNEVEEDAVYSINALSLLDNNKISYLMRCCINSEQIKTDFVNGSISNNGVYTAFDKIFTGLEYKTYNYDFTETRQTDMLDMAEVSDGNGNIGYIKFSDGNHDTETRSSKNWEKLLKEVYKDLDTYSVLAIKSSGYLDIVEDQSKDKMEVSLQRYYSQYYLEDSDLRQKTGNIINTCRAKGNGNEEENSIIRCQYRYTIYKMITEYINFGDGSSLSISAKDFELTYPLADTDTWLEFGESSQYITRGLDEEDIEAGWDFSAIGNLLSDICGAEIPDPANGTKYDEFKNKLDKFVNEIMPECTLKGIMRDFQEEMCTEAEKQQIKTEQDFIIPETDELVKRGDSPYDIVNAILGLNIYCLVNKNKYFSSGQVLKVKDGEYIYLTTTFSSTIPDNVKKLFSNVKTLKDYWSQLTAYQQDCLKISYRNIIDVRELHGDVLTDIYSNDLTGVYTAENAEKFASSVGSDFMESIQNVVRNRDDKLYDTYSVYNIARNANTLGQYIIGVSLYGSDEDSDIYSIYDETLAGFMKKDYTQTGINTTWYPSNLPSKISLFGNNSEYYTILLSDKVAFEAFVSFLYNISYAFDVAAFSEGGLEHQYDYKSICAYLKGSGDEEESGIYSTLFSWLPKGTSLKSLNGQEEKFNNDDISINMMRSIIELHDLCEFLGILQSAKNGGWTEAIAEYLELYDTYESFFNDLRNNPVIYSYADKGESTEDEPLGIFFNIDDKKMSDQWCKGFAISALYVPMETNLYDATSISYINDPDFISEFYYKYAFYRKALYINTDNSAIVNAKVSSSTSGTRVATLKDLINYERDIILTVDDNFYNARDIDNVIGKLDYTSVRNGSNVSTEDASLWDSVKGWVSDLLNLSPDQILKTGANSYYSSTLADRVTKLGDTPDLLSSIADVYVLSYDDLLGENSVFDEYEYSVKQSYGIVSAVYRSAELYNECLRALATDNAIFKSSKGICSTPGTTSSDWRCIYNYCMLANLEEQMKNDAASTLDLNAPIFCDLFGNIVTESGLVIIPAACNATLCGTNWNPNTVGWSEYYNNGNRLKIGEFSDEVYTWLTGVTYSSMETVSHQVQYIDHYYGEEEGETDEDKKGNPVYKTNTLYVSDTVSTVGQYGEEVKRTNAGGYMIVDRSGQLMLRTSSLTGQATSAIIQWENLNKNSTVVKDLLYNDAYFNKAASGEIYSKTIVNLVVETLRGAPIEYIDYEYEGLSGNIDISKLGVFSAYCLENISNALISGTNGNSVGGNALITMPNLAFVSGIEYIVLYVFKIAFAVMIFGLAISLYMDTVQNKLGIKSVGKFIYTCFLVLVSITLIPNLISWSYYKANKDLLADEAGYIMMLNYVKDYDGAEIGITEVTTPETTTELYIKMDDISVSWWDIIDEVLFGNTIKTVTELYESQLKENAMAMQENVQLKGDGLYMNVQDIFDSTSVIYYPSQNRLSNIAYSSREHADKDSVVSFVLPYYVILDKLTASVDEYNRSKDITAYSYSVGANGHIVTYDIISPYLTSSEFLDEGFDILGLNEILQTSKVMTSYTEGLFTEEQINVMKSSRWYPTGSTLDDLTQDRINKVYTYAREYITRNKDVLGKVPDEVFLKVFALQIAVKYNQVFNIHSGNAIELMNIDTRDIARLLVSDRGTVYKYYSYGFSRFLYEEAGTLGVICAAFYFVILWFTSIVKPLFLLAIIGLLIVNVLFRKILFRKESRCIEGYMITCACIVLNNYAYALMLKVSLLTAEYGFGAAISLVLALAIQIAYVVGLILILYAVRKDWQNVGFNEYAVVGSSITSGLMRAHNVVVDKIMARQNVAYGNSMRTHYNGSDKYDMSSVDEMQERDARREQNGMYNSI